jgi:superfamily II DNA or RNA helicase
MTIRRLSSRTQRLDQSFLAEQLQGARSYRRIAGYFTSSLFEVAHEWLETVADVRIVCNVDLSPEDLKVAQLREARMLGRWNERSIEAESLLNRERYQRLDAFLAKRGQVIRVAPDSVCGFVHGKAGVIERADGQKLGFIGSMNETRHGWQRHYEILWEDDSPEGVAWIEAEFEHLWNAARPLPEAVCREVSRRGRRYEVLLPQIDAEETLTPAALIESPLYREGMSLQPWQQGFVAECLRHYNDHGQVRLLLADEVGLGKTLSLGTAALTLCLLAEKTRKRRKPIVIFAPATLCEQWQTEMLDKLGIPCARWHSNRKVWLDPDERAISPGGPEQIARCPLRIGIVSTGLMVQPSEEKTVLTGISFELVILDEAHKARSRQGFGANAGEPNALLAFMRAIADRADHLLLGTATPIQTRAEDLWDLVGVLHRGSSGFVLGSDFAPWHDPQRVLPILSGAERVEDLDYGWRLLRSPLPTMESTNEPNARRLFRNLREDLGLRRDAHLAGALTELPPDLRDDLETELERIIDGAAFFQRENPLVRHVVLRKRTTLEARGLLDRIGVNVHPYDTARWVADTLAAELPDETIGLYAGADRSRLYRNGQAVGIVREELKRMVADHQVRLMVATDAACEGLNLQTLGTLINVDLPWNPTRLEQRIGRIKRFGQVRSTVDMLNLVHQGTVDEKVYARLSERMRNRYDLFGGLPDTIRDDWIDDLETLGERMDQYIEERRQATGFDLRYNDSIKPSDDAWRDCATVLARRDVENLMRQGWSG